MTGFVLEIWHIWYIQHEIVIDIRCQILSIELGACALGLL